MHYLKRVHHAGFTIVELLIVIVVIAILASITIVAFNGVQTSARNTAKLSEVKAWNNLFEIYKVTNGSYPNMSNGGYCLGTGFPDTSGDGKGDCRDLYYAPNRYSVNTTLNDALATSGSLPSSSIRTEVKGTLGPYVEYLSDNTIQIIGTFELTSPSTPCPGGLKNFWHDNDKLSLCGYLLTK